jgi:hypothetical protein
MPDCLPEMAIVYPWTSTTYEMLYKIFCRDIRDHIPQYMGHNVWIYRDMEDGKEILFWHLTTRTSKQKMIPRRKLKFYPDNQVCSEPERLPDLRRCERLPWVKPLIERSSEPEVLSWDYEECDLTIKTYIWVKDYDFVVIMKKYSDGKRRLITSFYVDENYKRDDFKRKYENRIK